MKYLNFEAWEYDTDNRKIENFDKKALILPKITQIEHEIPNNTNLVKKTDYGKEVKETENKTPSTTGRTNRPEVFLRNLFWKYVADLQ